jgi:CIC family chloride channel protein
MGLIKSIYLADAARRANPFARDDLIMNWLLRLDRTPRLILLSLFLGVVGALGAQLFLWLLHLGEIAILQPNTGFSYISVEAAHALGKAPLIDHWYWLVPVSTTLGGLLAGFIVYTCAPEAEGHGTDAAVKAFHRNDGKVRARVPLIKTIASAITIGSGGAAGREGPTAQIAAGIGSIVATQLRLPVEERRYLVLIGMAAGLSAIFKSPLGTAIFSVEILYASMAFEAEVLIFSLIAAAVAYAITGVIEGFRPLFILPPNVGIVSATELVWYALLGLIAGIVGALLPSVFYYIRDAFGALKVPNQVKPAIGGFILGIIGIFVPQLLGAATGTCSSRCRERRAWESGCSCCSHSARSLPCRSPSARAAPAGYSPPACSSAPCSERRWRRPFTISGSKSTRAPWRSWVWRPSLRARHECLSPPSSWWWR